MPLDTSPLGGGTSRRVPFVPLVPGSPPAGRAGKPRLAGLGPRLLAILATVALVGLLLLTPGPAVGVAHAQSQTQDFALAINHNGPTGFLVIGGLAGCPLCVSTVEPRYVVADPLGCFYDQNSIGVVSIGDFAGTVNLEVLNLPQGVSNQTAASVNVPRRGATSTPFRLQAAANAPAGNATVTLRATSGSIVHTADLPISVVSQLPPCQ